MVIYKFIDQIYNSKSLIDFFYRDRSFWWSIILSVLQIPWNVTNFNEIPITLKLEFKIHYFRYFFFIYQAEKSCNLEWEKDTNESQCQEIKRFQRSTISLLPVRIKTVTIKCFFILLIVVWLTTWVTYSFWTTHLLFFHQSQLKDAKLNTLIAEW